MIPAAMREPIVVTGLGVVSALATTREAFYAALAAGRSAIAEDPDLLASGYPLVARVGDFDVRRWVEAKALRRLTRLAQMALVAAKQAMQQGGLAPDPLRTGIVFATGLGTIRETLDFMTGCLRDGPATGSPSLFPVSVMNAAAGQIAVELGLRGVNTTLNHRESSPFAALMLAADQLALPRADALLVIAADDLCPPALHGYRRLGGLTRTGLRPYALDRDGTVLGDGAGALLLERRDHALARGAVPLARLAGIGAAGDHGPRVGWAKDHGGLVRAIRGALVEAQMDGAAIDYIAGAGNGLRGDALEARALVEALPPAVPCSSITGQTGESMSAGIFRLAAALYALAEQALPGTVGAGVEDPAAPLPGLIRAPRPSVTVRHVLIPEAAQGGAAFAAVLAQP